MTDRVLIAPDAFKGTLRADQVAAALARGLAAAGASADECPIADGGEGTGAILLAAAGGELRDADCSDPLGRPLRASWAFLADGSAVVEAASASGLALLAMSELDAEAASTAGTGQLILGAIAAGARHVIVAIGGTASTDGGAGALEAIAGGGGLGGACLTLACDVRTPFERAAELFAPGKGASPAAVGRLRERLERLALELPRDPRGHEMTGAGGGLAGGLWSVHGGELTSGADLVLERVGFDKRLERADAVIIGEGRLDSQSLVGKAAGAVLQRARDRGVPVHAVVGAAEIDRGDPAWRELASVQVAGDLASLARLAGTWPWPH